MYPSQYFLRRKLEAMLVAMNILSQAWWQLLVALRYVVNLVECLVEVA